MHANPTHRSSYPTHLSAFPIFLSFGEEATAKEGEFRPRISLSVIFFIGINRVIDLFYRIERSYGFKEPIFLKKKQNFSFLGFKIKQYYVFWKRIKLTWNLIFEDFFLFKKIVDVLDFTVEIIAFLFLLQNIRLIFEGMLQLLMIVFCIRSSSRVWYVYLSFLDFAVSDDAYPSAYMNSASWNGFYVVVLFHFKWARNWIESDLMVGRVDWASIDDFIWSVFHKTALSASINNLTLYKPFYPNETLRS